MKTLNRLIAGCLLVIPMLSSAQDYTPKVLNKEHTRAITSNLHDYDGDGDLDIIIGQSDPDGLFWLENEPTQQFPKRPIVTEDIHDIADVDVADLDRDGDMDYVVCMSELDDGELAWFQRQSNGSYVKWTIASNKDFIMADLADFNGDGWMDVAAVGLVNSDNTGRVYFNQGNLFFEEVIVAQGGINTSLDAEDIDGDLDVDIVWGGFGLVQDSTGSRIMLNDGSGNFSLDRFIHCFGPLHNGCQADVLVVDLNQDGKKDVIAHSGAGVTKLYLLDPVNDFQDAVLDIDGTETYGQAVVFDIDQDGRLDIVRQNEYEYRLLAMYQREGFEFETEYLDINWDNAGNPTAKMSVGDLNRDGLPDLVFPEIGNTDWDLSWYENIEGKLYRHELYSELTGVRIPKFADIDNDGDLDVVATLSKFVHAENEVVLYENLDGENFVSWRVHDNIDYAADIEVADIDGDKDLDLVVTARDANDLVWLENTGKLYEWTYHEIETNANAPLGCAVADIDNDGFTDIAMTSSGDDKVFWYKNDGAGNFQKRIVSPNLDAPREIELTDLDRDGDMDIVVACTGTANSIALFINPGDENFVSSILHAGQQAYDVEVGDWSGNGRTDIVACFYSDTNNQAAGDIIAFENTADGFVATPLLYDDERTTALRLADLDDDKDLDVVYAQHHIAFGGLYTALNQDGDLDGVREITYGNGQRFESYGIDIADVNADGAVDILYADQGNANLVLLNGETEVTSTTDGMILEQTQIRLYPNPAAGKATVQWFFDDDRPVSYQLFDVNGRMMQGASRLNVSGEVFEVPLQNLPEGAYFLRVITEAGRVAVAKLVHAGN